jgi:putative ABC transport system permease protein
MRLAWSNIIHDRVRFLVTILGIVCAVFLMVFQGSVLFGFTRAASRLIDISDADLWITGRGVTCFEFPASLERRIVEIAYSVPGVQLTTRVCTRLAQFRMADGRRQMVALVGADPTVGTRYPLPYASDRHSGIQPQALIVDSSNLALLDIRSMPQDVEINEQRASVIGAATGFSSFVGSPYVFTSYADGARYLKLDSDETMFVLVRLASSVKALAVQHALRQRLPDVDVWTRDEFSSRARKYWLTQTGAGGAILMAALLGFCIGLAVVSQAIYSSTMENLEEFATLKALGATRFFIVRVILGQAVICGLVGYAFGALITLPLIRMARETIPWVISPPWLPAAVLAPTLAMCAVASMASVRAALLVEPARVFRA